MFPFCYYILHIWKEIVEELKHLTVIDQEMVAINDQQIPIYMRLLY